MTKRIFHISKVANHTRNYLLSMLKTTIRRKFQSWRHTTFVVKFLARKCFFLSSLIGGMCSLVLVQQKQFLFGKPKLDTLILVVSCTKRLHNLFKCHMNATAFGASICVCVCMGKMQIFILRKTFFVCFFLFFC